MKQGALAFDDVPVIVIGIRAQLLGRARNEVRNHGVERNAAAGDQHAGLAGRTKICVVSPTSEFTSQHQCGVFLAERAVRADSEQTLPAALAARRDRNSRGRAAHVDEPSTETFSGSVELAIVGEYALSQATVTAGLP